MSTEMWIRLYDDRGTCSLVNVDSRFPLLSQLRAASTLVCCRFIFRGRPLRADDTAAKLVLGQPGSVNGIDVVSPCPPSDAMLEVLRHTGREGEDLIFYARYGTECAVSDGRN